MTILGLNLSNHLLSCLFNLLVTRCAGLHTTPTRAWDSFIDEALLLGINELRIIHGKGNGILREVIRNYLRDYNYIKSIADESVEQGGAGVSVVSLE